MQPLLNPHDVMVSAPQKSPRRQKILSKPTTPISTSKAAAAASSKNKKKRNAPMPEVFNPAGGLNFTRSLKNRLGGSNHVAALPDITHTNHRGNTAWGTNAISLPPLSLPEELVYDTFVEDDNNEDNIQHSDACEAEYVAAAGDSSTCEQNDEDEGEAGVSDVLHQSPMMESRAARGGIHHTTLTARSAGSAKTHLSLDDEDDVSAVVWVPQQEQLSSPQQRDGKGGAAAAKKPPLYVKAPASRSGGGEGQSQHQRLHNSQDVSAMRDAAASPSHAFANSAPARCLPQRPTTGRKGGEERSHHRPAPRPSSSSGGGGGGVQRQKLDVIVLDTTAGGGDNNKKSSRAAVTTSFGPHGRYAHTHNQSGMPLVQTSARCTTAASPVSRTPSKGVGHHRRMSNSESFNNNNNYMKEMGELRGVKTSKKTKR